MDEPFGLKSVDFVGAGLDLVGDVAGGGSGAGNRRNWQDEKHRLKSAILNIILFITLS
jgi:hypothetical protein